MCTQALPVIVACLSYGLSVQAILRVQRNAAHSNAQDKMDLLMEDLNHDIQILERDAKASSGQYNASKDGYYLNVIKPVGNFENVPKPDLAQSVLVIIDVQKDFTTDGLHLAGPPYPDSHPLSQVVPKPLTFGNLLDSFWVLDKAISDFAGEKGKFKKVIASRDYHPVDHCSFGGIGNKAGKCLNKNDEKMCLTANGMYDKGDCEKRYHNDFPVHCVIPETLESDNCSKTYNQEPSWDNACWANKEGSLLTDKIEKIITRYEDTADVVFKGYDKLVESFSAFKHVHSKMTKKNQAHTGGCSPQSCKAKQSEADDLKCMPAVAELEDKEKCTDIEKLIPEDATSIIIVGLVYDFCVGESSMNAKESFPEKNVYVVADLARPAAQGVDFAPVRSTGEELKAVTQHLLDNGIYVVNSNFLSGDGEPFTSETKHIPQPDGTMKLIKVGNEE